MPGRRLQPIAAILARPGTRFGPQGIRKISALYGPYSFELGVDLRESITMCDIGDIFTIPANIEKTFDQISKAVGHVYASGAFPVVLGGDHSIGYPTVRGVAEQMGDKKLGIIHFDRHVDTQETDLDERMHTTPWFHAIDIPNVPPAAMEPALSCGLYPLFIMIGAAMTPRMVTAAGSLTP